MFIVMKEKLIYIWEEHKLLLLAAALIAALPGIFWSDFFSPDNKETAFCAVVVGQGYDYDREKMLARQTLAALGLDEKKEQVVVDLSLEPQLDAEGVPPESAYLDQMKMTMYLTGGEGDVVVSDETVLSHYNGLGAAADLRDIFSEEELMAWEDSVFAEQAGTDEIPRALRISGDFAGAGETYVWVSKKAPHMELVGDFIRALCGLS